VIRENISLPEHTLNIKIFPVVRWCNFMDIHRSFAIYFIIVTFCKLLRYYICSACTCSAKREY
jgi:hypothetical protein